MPRLSLLFKALRELGPRQVGLFAWYQILLRSGYYRWATPDPKTHLRSSGGSSHPICTQLFELPDQEKLTSTLGSAASRLIDEADEIVSGQVRLFGGPPVPLRLEPDEGSGHWTEYELGQKNSQSDIKFTWEPARFGWVFKLGRAYLLNRDERYAQTFWSFTERFLEANPPYYGMNWTSGQEVALRLMALIWASQVFGSSENSTPGRMSKLAEAIAFHAARIPITLPYARAQQNNHLLTEAAGLYTAGLALPSHPSAQRWRELGWRWLNRGLQDQIEQDGTYAQNSANYHRLMLLTALWARRFSKRQSKEYPAATLQRLAAATVWLLELVDPENGCAPNLGPNDGSYILPLTVCPFGDYRPVVQAASQAFLQRQAFQPGLWDEMSLWLVGIENGTDWSRHLIDPGQAGFGRTEFNTKVSSAAIEKTPHVLRARSSWAYLRAAHFRSRPGHADQLHLDLWWRGINLAQDAGTYLYNAAPPWDNSLARTEVHNTLTLDGQDQMLRAGRFLWLDWAQARVIAHERGPDGAWERLSVEHDGYRRLGAIHRREVTSYPDDHWTVVDSVLPSDVHKAQNPQLATICLHWLLPDWEWDIENRDLGILLRLGSPYDLICLDVSVEYTTRPLKNNSHAVRLVRAGEPVYEWIRPGSSQPEVRKGVIFETAGWVSPTYGQKIPALSLMVEVQASLPARLTSEWSLPCTSS